MKPRNAVYIGGPPDPDEALMIKCTYCGVTWHNADWRKQNGKCPGCGKPYAGEPSED